MAFSLVVATRLTAMRGQGVTYGKNANGGTLLIAPGRLTLAALKAQHKNYPRVADVVSVEYQGNA